MSSKIEVIVEDSWINLKVEGDITVSYPVFGNDEEIDKMINGFSECLKKAIKGERISTLG